MPDRASSPAEDGPSSPEKLTFAVLSAWQSGGASDVSARNLAAATGLPTSSIHYYFGGLGRLLEMAQGEALAAANRWCDAWGAAIGPEPATPEMLGPLLAALIDDWCETQRTLAFAQREGQLMALRDPACAPLAGAWEAMWRGHFERICAQMGLGDLARLTGWFFDGASALHMMRWRRPLDRAALEDLCRGWADWIQGRLASNGAWFARARADAEGLIAPGDAASLDPLAVAAADTLADGGITALTHRAVAARAGMTLGMVSYRYRTSADLLQAAYEVIYHRMITGGGAASDLDAAAAIAVLDGGIPSRTDLLGSEELAVAAARREDLQPFAAQLRYLRGRSSRRLLQAILPADRAVSQLDGAVFSALMGGRMHSAVAAGSVVADGRASDLAPIFARLSTG